MRSWLVAVVAGESEGGEARLGGGTLLGQWSQSPDPLVPSLLVAEVTVTVAGHCRRGRVAVRNEREVGGEKGREEN